MHVSRRLTELPSAARAMTYLDNPPWLLRNRLFASTDIDVDIVGDIRHIGIHDDGVALYARIEVVLSKFGAPSRTRTNAIT